MEAKKVHHYVTMFFFAALLIFGFIIVDDYGMSWDETYSRDQNGVIAFNYVFNNDVSTYQKSDERYHGTAIELPLYGLEKAIEINDVRTIYLFRHYMTFLLFVFSSFMFYKLMRLIYDDWWIAFTGLVIYVFTPRIFADAFYNSKDVGFLSVFTIAMYSGYKFLQKQDLKTILLHGFVCGFLIATRISGVIMPVITIGVYFIQQFLKINSKSWTNLVIVSCIFLIVTYLITILFWPILWHSPIIEFANAWIQISHFHWNKDILYFGEFISENNIPWHYMPVWIGITTPIITLVLCIIGCFIVLYELIKTRANCNNLIRTNVIFVIYLFLPIASIIILKSVVYDGWRHLFFLHAPMVALICFTIYKFTLKLSLFKKNIFYVILTLLYLPCFISMAQLHPYENLYFNKLKFKSTGDARFNMDLDYWGLSYRKALEFLVKSDHHPEIHVKVDTYPGKLNAVLLPIVERKRIIFEDDIKNADYFIGNYRWMKNEYPYTNEIYCLSVDRAKVMVCYKLR